MPELELRPRQAALIDKISEAWRAGHKNVMVCAPCGFGKTEIATAVLLKANSNYKRGAFICDRIALIEQTSERFDKYGLAHGVMQAQHWRYRPVERIQVCSIQTIRRRHWPDSDLLVCDEAHVLPSEMRKKLSERSRFAIGLSATPVTPGLGKYFDCIVNGATTNELIAEGYLVPYRIFSCAEPDMSGVKVVAGEWEEKETSKRALEVVGDVVGEYIKHGNGAKFIAFAVDVTHAEELQREFMHAGIVVNLYTYRQDDADRARFVEEFRKPDSYIRGLISIESLTRGFDVADVEVLILARPLRKALHVHLQMLGRVLRTSPGKSEATVLDHAGNCARFWSDMQDIYERGVSTLDDGKKREKPKTKPADEELRMVKCPECAHLHIARPACPNCGWEYPRRLAVQHVPGTLTELVATGNRRLMTAELWPQVASYARRMRDDPEKARKLALALYKQITDTWPAAEFSNTPDAPISNAVLGKIRSLNIAYSRRPKAEVRA